MKYLLDTHVFIWWLEADKKLTSKIKSVIDNPDNIKFVSVVTFWEIVIKVHAKKLILKIPVRDILKNFEFEVLNIFLTHVLKLEKLPNYHKDPFDRMLVAQAKVEDCTLITKDPKIKRYKVKIIG